MNKRPALGSCLSVASGGRCGGRAPVGLVVPDDLRHWVDEPVLVRAVLEAVSGLALGSGPAAPLREEGESYPPAMLLSLLSYSYATGRFSSEAVETALKSDPAVAYLAACQLPSAAVIQRFRRGHRDRLEQVLAELLTQCLRPPKTDPAAGGGGSSGAASETTAQVELAREEAQRRIERAVLEDAVAADV